jgi:hypothetical protein
MPLLAFPLHASVGISSPSEQLQTPESTPSQTLFSITPLDKIKEKVVATPGPWSKQLLDLATQNKTSDQDLCPASHRSARKKDQLKGYKGSTCANKNCLGCDMVPPTISPSIIRNLGASFCKVDAEKLSVEALAKKNKVAALGGKNSARSLSPKNHPMKMFPSPPRRSPRSEQKSSLMVGFSLWNFHLHLPFILVCNFKYSPSPELLLDS